MDPGGLRDAIDGTRDLVNDTVDTVGEKIREVRTSIDESTDLIREGAGTIGPVGLFVGAAVVGMVLGSVLPVSKMENARLGPVRERFKKQARAAGAQLLKKGQRAILDTIAAAKGPVT